MTSSRPTVVDLFSGCGGMSLGLEAAGFDIAAGIELDPIHCLVHHFNFPYSTSICNDISAVTANDIHVELESAGFDKNVDLVVGGPPCQGFSHIGKRAFDDPRNHLLFEYHRLIDELKPGYFIFENVPGLSSGKHRSFLSHLVSEFDRIGYSVVQPIQILEAAAFGVPQKRRRIILLGYRSGMPTPSYPAPLHAEGGDLCKDIFTIPHYVGSADAISDLADYEVFTSDDPGIPAYDKIYQGYQQSYDFEPNGDFALCHKRNVEKVVWGHLGSEHTDISIQRFSETEPGETERISRFFKLHPDRPCHTLRAGTASDRGAFTAPRPIHYKHARCITVREAARLHGFPDWFQFHRTIWHGFREIGNSVAPMLAKRLGDEIVKSMGLTQSDLKTRQLQSMDESLLTFNMSQSARYWNVSNDVIPKRRRQAG